MARMDDALAEAVRVSERVLDHQLQSLLAERGDLERLMRLGVAALAGTLAIAGLMVQVGADSKPATALLSAGVLLQTLATAGASRAARPTEVINGPDLMDVYRGMGDGWTGAHLRRSLLQAAAVAQRYNNRKLDTAARRVRSVSILLFIGSGCVLAGMAYVVGGGIFA